MDKYKVTLSQDEREELIGITRSGKHAAKKIIHALILLNIDRGPFAIERQTNKEICKVLKIGMPLLIVLRSGSLKKGLKEH